MGTPTSCSTYTCPVYGNLPHSNLQGLPPIPLCCFSQNHRPCRPIKPINLEKEELCICDVLPVPEGFDLSYLLVNLPVYLALLISAVPRWLACLIYDVGIALRGIVSSVDELISGLLDLFLALFIGFAEGASFGGCYIVSQIANFLFHADIKLPKFGDNCPFCYTLNQTLQGTLEQIGFALGTPIGLINLIVGLLLDSVALILCYLSNLTVNFGICIWLFSFELSFSPFSFLSAITPFNCGCVLGQLGVCPVLNLVYGCKTSANCEVTNSNCPCLTTQGSGNRGYIACQNSLNYCVSTVSQWASTQLAQCRQNYADAVASCSTALSTCLSTATSCYDTAVNNCQTNYSNCVSQASTYLQNCLAGASTSLQDCLANASTCLQNCQDNCSNLYGNDPTALANCYAQCQQNYATSVQYCESQYATSESECQNNYAISTQQCQSTYNSCVTSAQQCLASAQACCHNAHATCVSLASTSESTCESTVTSIANSDLECCNSQYSECENGRGYDFGDCYNSEDNVAQNYAGYNFNCTGTFNCGG